ncbi:flavodoxin family protein [Thalassotalea montiporae]
MRIAIVLGTSRREGNTAKLVNDFISNCEQQVSLYQLSDFHILPYDYEFANQTDDFSTLIDEVVTKHDVILLASPIYWYSPSAQMKVFMDRLTDLLEINKPLGRQLKGKAAGVIATGVDEQPAHSFEQIFSLTFEYLHMRYLGMIYESYPDDGSNAYDSNVKIEQYESLIQRFQE